MMRMGSIVHWWRVSGKWGFNYRAFEIVCDVKNHIYRIKKRTNEDALSEPLRDRLILAMADIEISRKYVCDKESHSILEMYKSGFMKGISISTNDLEYYTNQFGGEDIVKAELIEISAVTIPMNEDSLKK